MKISIIEHSTGKIDKRGKEITVRGKYIKIFGRYYPVQINETEFLELDKEKIISEEELKFKI
jgi:hypothetical protein